MREKCFEVRYQIHSGYERSCKLRAGTFSEAVRRAVAAARRHSRSRHETYGRLTAVIEEGKLW